MDDLQNLFDAFGADPARWPAASRAAAQALLDSSAEARELMREAAAVDALLSRASTLPAGRLATLSDRITSAAARVSQADAHEFAKQADDGRPDRSTARPAATVVPFRPPAAAGRPASATRPQGAAEAALRARSHPSPWRAATALAASLAFGIVVGSLDLSPLPVQSFLEIVGPDQEVGQLVATLNAEGFQSQLDEDQL